MNTGSVTCSKSFRGLAGWLFAFSQSGGGEDPALRTGVKGSRHAQRLRRKVKLEVRVELVIREDLWCSWPAATFIGAELRRVGGPRMIGWMAHLGRLARTYVPLRHGTYMKPV